MENYYNKNYYNISTSKDILKRVINNLPGNWVLKIGILKSNWKEIIGERLYQYTEPARIYHNILYVNCNHPVWVNTLQFQKEDILKNIHRKFHDMVDVSDLKFQFWKRKTTSDFKF